MRIVNLQSERDRIFSFGRDIYFHLLLFQTNIFTCLYSCFLYSPDFFILFCWTFLAVITRSDYFDDPVVPSSISNKHPLILHLEFLVFSDLLTFFLVAMFKFLVWMTLTSSLSMGINRDSKGRIKMGESNHNCDDAEVYII